MSRQSSLSASFSDLNITMHNVGIGSPQVTSVISDNSDNHSSEYYTPPFESMEGRIRRLTPPQFLPLIDQLLLARSNAIMKPTRSAIAIALFRYGTDVYQRAGVTRFWEYILQAEQASLVVLGEQGSQGEQSWIALHPNLFKEDTTTGLVKEIAVESVEDKVRRLTPPQFLPLIEQLLLARSKGTMKPTRSAITIALFRYGTDVYQRAGVTRFWEYILQAEQASLVVLGGQEIQGEQSWIGLHPDLFKEETTAEPVEEIAVEFVDETAIESVEDKIRRLTPPQFLPLIEQLLLARLKGIVKPGMSTIAFTLLRYDKDAYKRMGVNKFRDYASLAEQASLIELGGWEGDAWIALHPNWFQGGN
ncbi:hypothetical protein AZE42_12266 [Rhizopogon vesiculosus]|uniref:Uncharacterized protein n=1 Tax=Rhizopogon vesiculosus TaxID=180088 RepID=A0A1J8QFT4_9AGAM|nr:hypothetical protein AZE42_12266 [Rhizopogon vesiculosus]